MIRVDALMQHPPAKSSQARRVGDRHGHLWCHLFADTPEELPELHRIAAAVGMKRSWFQDAASMPHYDLVPPRREAALRAGAVEGDRQQVVAAIRAHRAARTTS